MKDQLIYISKRPLWHYLITLPLYCLVIPMFFKMFDLLSLGQILNGLKFLLAIMFVFFCAAGLTFKKRVFTNSKLKDVCFNFTLFNIPLCKDIIFNDIKYISVYKNHSDRDFEIKLWLTETKKKSVSVHLDLESAFELANKIANGLEVNLLDATEKGNFKWIEKENQS